MSLNIYSFIQHFLAYKKLKALTNHKPFVFDGKLHQVVYTVMLDEMLNKTFFVGTSQNQQILLLVVNQIKNCTFDLQGGKRYFYVLQFIKELSSEGDIANMGYKKFN